MMPEIWDVQTKQKVRFPPKGQDPSTMPMQYLLMLQRFMETTKVVYASVLDGARGFQTTGKVATHDAGADIR